MIPSTPPLLRAEAARTRRMGAVVFDPLTQRLLAESAEDCDAAADRPVACDDQTGDQVGSQAFTKKVGGPDEDE